ncbi:MAG: FprA family A-type flavoprotein [Anaerolineaceae bacterium]|nr:FprA family A-type flavoprotein [Anaerolineaceae bacterium]
MKAKKITRHVKWMGAVDWDRQLFDALIPLPDGTSYNAYLVSGSEKIVLLDTVDPNKLDVLMEQLEDVPELDYIVSHHAEQDHSGSIPMVLDKYPEAIVLASDKNKTMLMDLLHLPEEKIQVVKDGEKLSLGDLTMEFIYTPWVHWPETMSTYLEEEKILFSCDFFGSHLATSELYAHDESVVYEAAKRYYAEIMMPFRKPIEKNMQRLAPYQIDIIAPSHGPVYDHPKMILDAYNEWVSAPPKNEVVLAYISMHESTKIMAEYLLTQLADQGVKVQLFNLETADIGKFAMSLVDAGTIVIGTPTVLGGPHPNAAYAALLTSALKPKNLFAAVIGSNGWGGGAVAVDKLSALMPNFKDKFLKPAIARGLPDDVEMAELDRLANEIVQKHKEAGLK